MQAGKLDQVITITPVASRTQDAFNSTIETPGTPFQVPANVREQSAAEKQRNGITTTDKTYAITIRYRKSLDNDTSFTIAYRDRTLAVSSNTAGGRQNREWLFIQATEAA